jgi:hypothetical protein
LFGQESRGDRLPHLTPRSSGGRPSSPASSSREKLCPSTEAISTASRAGAVSRTNWPVTESTSWRGQLRANSQSRHAAVDGHEVFRAQPAQQLGQQQR